MLELLGLNKYEATSYEALVKLGKAGAQEISRESTVPYGRIYDVLNSLVAKGLIVVIPEPTKKFMASDPENLNKILNDKLKAINNLKSEIQELKKIYEVTEQEPIEIAKGKRNFSELLHKMDTPKKYEYTIKFKVDTKPEWIRDSKKREKEGVVLKTLVKYDETTKKNIETWNKSGAKKQMRKFEFDNIAARIVDDKETLFALIESNVTILIRDKQFTKLIKKFFEIAWEKSEKI